jgi:hypothetical protein
VIAAFIVIDLTNPAGAQATGAPGAEGPLSPPYQDSNAAPFTRCLEDWDAGTHMTSQEWSAACRRLLLQRGDYLRKSNGRGRYSRRHDKRAASGDDGQSAARQLSQ